MGKAVVVGLARSGLAAANLLRARNYEVTVTDTRTEEELKDMLGELAPGVERALGGHPARVFEGAELVVVSPGVPLDIEPLERARGAGAEVIGELELAYRALAHVPFYAVTGTNGKSTTVTLLDIMLDTAGFRTLLGGNIGNPLAGEIAFGENGELLAPVADCVVAEVSSFQLESIDTFRPTGASVLNITPDHLDRYASMDEYRAAKGRITLNQNGENVLVLNADDPECMKLHDSILREKGKRSPRIFFFSRKREVRGVFLRGDTVCWDFRGSGEGELIRADEIGIQGVHNLENAMAASALALLAGCDEGAVRESLRKFKGLPHRLELVREVGGVRYVNDSKGTNVGAVVRSVESFEEPVVLIAGGRDKNGDFKKLASAIKGRVKAVVLMGEAKEKIKAALEDTVICYLAGDLRDAVRQASGLASTGEVVLLSPACASFDMFCDFEDRGEQFRRTVMGL